MRREVLVGMLLVCLVLEAIPVTTIAQPSPPIEFEGMIQDKDITISKTEGGYKIGLRNNLWWSELDVFFDGVYQGKIPEGPSWKYFQVTHKVNHVIVSAAEGSYDEGRAWHRYLSEEDWPDTTPTPTAGEFAIKVIDVTGKPVKGASVMILKYFETHRSIDLSIIDSGETNSEGFYCPSVDLEGEECDLITVNKGKWFNSIDLQSMGELPEVIEVPLVNEILDTAEIEVCEGKYEIFVWRGINPNDPLENTFYVELNEIAPPLPERGVFGFTKDESVDVYPPGIIWFSNKDLTCLKVKEQKIPSFGIYPQYKAFYIPDSTTIKKKELLEEAGDTIVGLIPYVGNVYSFFDFVFGVFGEEKVIYSGQHPSKIDIDENKYDTTFEAWESDVLLKGRHVVVYRETMKFPEPGEYRIVPFVQFHPCRIDCFQTCVWTKEINVHISEKTGIGMEKPAPNLQKIFHECLDAIISTLNEFVIMLKEKTISVPPEQKAIENVEEDLSALSSMVGACSEWMKMIYEISGVEPPEGTEMEFRYHILGAKFCKTVDEARTYMSSKGIKSTEMNDALELVKELELEKEGFCIVIVDYSFTGFGEKESGRYPIVCNEKGDPFWESWQFYEKIKKEIEEAYKEYE